MEQWLKDLYSYRANGHQHLLIYDIQTKRIRLWGDLDCEYEYQLNLDNFINALQDGDFETALKRQNDYFYKRWKEYCDSQVSSIVG